MSLNDLFNNLLNSMKTLKIKCRSNLELESVIGKMVDLTTEIVDKNELHIQRLEGGNIQLRKDKEELLKKICYLEEQKKYDQAYLNKKITKELQKQRREIDEENRTGIHLKSVIYFLEKLMLLRKECYEIDIRSMIAQCIGIQHMLSDTGFIFMMKKLLLTYASKLFFDVMILNFKGLSTFLPTLSGSILSIKYNRLEETDEGLQIKTTTETNEQTVAFRIVLLSSLQDVDSMIKALNNYKKTDIVL